MYRNKTSVTMPSLAVAPTDADRFPPRLREYYRRGFNCRTGDFISRDVFRFGDEVETHNYYGADVDVPKELIFTINSGGRSSERSEIYKSKAEYDEKLTLEFGLEWGALDLEASAESTLTTTRHVSFERDRTSTVMERRQNAYECFRPDDLAAEHLDATWLAALAELPAKLPADADRDHPQYQLYAKFFDRFGTHYLAGGTVGGKLVFVSQIHRSLVNSSGETSVSSGISAGYEGMIAKGKFNTTVAVESSRFLEQHREKFHHETYNMGGLMTDPESDVAAWAATVKDQPILLADSLSGSPKRGLVVQAYLIDIALPDDPQREDREDSMRRALAIYAPLEFRSLFSTPFHKQVNRVHRFDTDGFAVLAAPAPPDPRRGEIALRGSLRARAYSTTHAYAKLPAANVMLPGLAEQEISSAVAPETGASLQLFELRSGSLFGPIPPERRFNDRDRIEVTAPEDGLLICVSRNSAGPYPPPPSHGLTITVGDRNPFDLSDGSSRGVFAIPEGHTTIPINAGTTYKLQYYGPNTDEVHAAFAWVPLAPEVAFGPTIRVEAGIARPAETDGLLFGSMYADEARRDNKIGHYNVQVALPAEHIDWASVPAIPGASIIFPMVSDRPELHISGAAATHVVRMGYVYRVGESKHHQVDSQYQWTPLLRR